MNKVTSLLTIPLPYQYPLSSLPYPSINNTLREVLQRSTRCLDIPHVFFNQDTGKPYQDIKRAFAPAKKRVEPMKCPDCDYRKPRLKTKYEAGSCSKCGTKLAVIKGIEDSQYLRHTCASHCVLAGVDITTLSKLLGHKSLKMTLRYAHIVPSYLVKAVDILDKFLNGKKTISTERRGHRLTMIRPWKGATNAADLYPFQNPIVNIFSIYDSQDPNLSFNHLKDNSIIPYPQFPIAFQRLPQRFPVFMRGCHETFFYGLPDSFFKGHIQ
jgi:hypothetical protein